MAAPVLTLLNPTTVSITGGTVVPVTITGSGFLPTSIVTINGVDKSGTYVSATSMTGNINTLLLPGPDVVNVGVRNGAEASNTLPLTFTGTPAANDPNYIPDTPATGASPNTPAIRAAYTPPVPANVYQGKPVQVP